MKLNVEIKVNSNVPCALEVFKINGKYASIDDFGDNIDWSFNGTDDQYCIDHRFVRAEYDYKIEIAMEKYGIERKDYDAICDELERTLNLGKCKRCGFKQFLSAVGHLGVN